MVDRVLFVSTVVFLVVARLVVAVVWVVFVVLWIAVVVVVAVGSVSVFVVVVVSTVVVVVGVGMAFSGWRQAVNSRHTHSRQHKIRQRCFIRSTPFRVCI